MLAAEYGEDRLVASLLTQLPAADRSTGVRAGAGQDDCAVVRSPKGKNWQLLKTDCVIEGVHFDSKAAPEQVGWKALCRPLSDIAATGGKPVHALVTMALKRRATLAWATGVYAGIAQAAREFGVIVVGGETASTPGPSFLSVCVTGTVRRGRYILRGGGRPGDRLYVTGVLGGSLASGRHLTFRPRLEQAAWLAAHFPIRAMMDLSDGLAADLPRMAQASSTGYNVERDRIPIAEGCTVEQAMGDGEDYELLFALGPRKADKLAKAWERTFPDLRLTAIGKLDEPTITTGLESSSGYDHFAGTRPDASPTRKKLKRTATG